MDKKNNDNMHDLEVMHIWPHPSIHIYLQFGQAVLFEELCCSDMCERV